MTTSAACLDCRRPKQDSDECRESGLCLRCLNGPLPTGDNAEPRCGARIPTTDPRISQACALRPAHGGDHSPTEPVPAVHPEGTGGTVTVSPAMFAAMVASERDAEARAEAAEQRLAAVRRRIAAVIDPAQRGHQVLADVLTLIDRAAGPTPEAH